MNLLDLKNPHAVIAALHHRPQAVQEILIQGDSPRDAWEDVCELAQQHRVSIRQLRSGPRQHGGRRGEKSERVGHSSARIKPKEPGQVGQIFGKEQDAGVWLALDSLQDPHNVGAIFRTAAFFGIRGIVLTRDKSAPVNQTVYDIAAGGVETVPFCTVTNLNRTLKQAKDSGLWILGTSEHAEKSLTKIESDRAWLVVVGNEQKGLRRLVQEECDELCAISGSGSVTSLNVSVATGVMLSHLAK